jgi:hypothetical protein
METKMTPHFNHPDLVEARNRAKFALINKDVKAYSQAMFDHRNRLRELDPTITAQWKACQQKSLEKAFS